MPVMLKEAAITHRLADRKRIRREDVATLKACATPKSKDHNQVTIEVTGESGKLYEIRSRRKSDPNDPMAFSIILSCTEGNRTVNLIRCNGHHEEHTNQIEKNNGHPDAVIPENTCHIHRITERYQEAKRLPESFAVPTRAYSNFDEAVEHMCSNFGISVI